MKKYVLTFLVLLVLAAAAQADLTNLLTNPGAETGDISGWTVANPAETGIVSAKTSLGLTPDPGPHSGTYLFRSDNTSPTWNDCTWFLTQTVGTGGAPSATGYVWGATNSTEFVRLIVSEHYDSTWSGIYDSGWVRSNRAWTKLSFDWTALNPATYELEFKMGARKPANVGQGNNAGLDDAFLAVPVPGAALLGLLGLTAAGVKLRKRV